VYFTIEVMQSSKNFNVMVGMTIDVFIVPSLASSTYARYNRNQCSLGLE